MGGQWVIRDATVDDARACADIYAPYVIETAISFEASPPAAAEMAERITAAQSGHAWLVAEERGSVLGYAYGGPHKSRAAYRWACEVSVYVAAGRHRGGLGRQLYEALFSRLAQRGFRTVLAGMTLPNDGSVGLHRSLGFEPVGTYRRIGWKHGGWHDVAWSQRTIGSGEDPPTEPR